MRRCPLQGGHRCWRDPAEIRPWITEARAQRAQAEADLRQATARRKINREQIETMINKFADIAATIRDADPELLSDTQIPMQADQPVCHLMFAC